MSESRSSDSLPPLREHRSQSDFPMLRDLVSHQCYPLTDITHFLVGRSKEAHIPLLDLSCSRQQFEIHQTVNSDGNRQFELIPNRKAKADLLWNDQKLDDVRLLKHGDVIAVNASTFRFEAEWDAQYEAMQDSGFAAESLESAPTLRTVDEEHLVQSDSLRTEVPTDIRTWKGAQTAPRHPMAFPLPEQMEMVIGRDPQVATLQLNHVMVSRVHARVTRKRNEAIIEDANSSNGSFLNGIRIRRRAKLTPGDYLDIGPFRLLFDGRQLLVDPAIKDHSELVCRHVHQFVLERGTQEKILLLSDVSLKIAPSEFTVIVGPSGAGKSSLLSALSGRVPVQSGVVLLNGINLHREFEHLKQNLAVVSQHQRVHEQLSVQEVLNFTARLRLPADLSETRIDQQVADICQLVGLEELAKQPVHILSGGEKKRVVLGNELLSQPAILFLDEVTTGLDEQADREMMCLFRNLAEHNTTIVCVTHTLAHVEQTAHRIVVLGDGGLLTFSGSPGELTAFFQIDSLSDVYRRLQETSASEWHSRFKSTSYGKSLYSAESASPSVLLATTESHSGRELHSESGEISIKSPQSLKSEMGISWRETGILLHRMWAILRTDLVHVGMILFQVILITGLLGTIFSSSHPLDSWLPLELQSSSMLLFLMAISCFWFGCNNTVREIVQERAIFEAERNRHLNLFSYFLSCLLFWGGITVLQTAFLVGVLSWWCEIPGSVIQHGLLLSLLSVTGVSLGLAISAWTSKAEQGMALVPIVLIPQILLGNQIAKLSGMSLVFAKKLITIYWAREGYLSSVEERSGWGFAIFVIFIHFLVFSGFTIWNLNRTSRVRHAG